MAILFEVIDPRGYKIICTEETWNDHILARHSFIVGQERVLQETLKTPSLGIYLDAVRPDRQIYYRSDLHTKSYLKVVVQFQGNEGVVITAYLTDTRKKGEKRLWKKK